MVFPQTISCCNLWSSITTFGCLFSVHYKGELTLQIYGCLPDNCISFGCPVAILVVPGWRGLGGHSTVKWLGVLGTKRQTLLGLKNRFLAKWGLKSWNFKEIFEVKSWNFGQKWLWERRNSKNLTIFWLKIKNLRKLGSSERDQTATGGLMNVQRAWKRESWPWAYPYCPFMWVPWWFGSPCSKPTQTEKW